MGGGIAQLLAGHGIEVAVADLTPELSAASVEGLRASARSFEERGLLEAGGAAKVAETARSADSVAEAVAGAEFAIEAVAENPTVKRQVYAEIEAVAPADAVLATNTSAIPIRELAAELRHPERFLGTHWFNPPQWVPCVEVIAGPSTEGSVVDRVEALLGALGKRPVRAGDAAGFVANRIQFAMFKEAVSCVADGVADAEQVDEIVRSSFGHRLPFFGPFAIADMAGLDVYAGAYEALEAEHGARFAAPERLLELVESGRLGAKSGGGFLGPQEESHEERVERRDAAYVALSELLERSEGGGG
jgi:3-hydroxybutyryl-CoA dehydrogenase